ncbi:SURF1 family protein [Specibacter cremeus]|uniref:SURF1 family protein n=1 Tax=Specibacter cremeus TaxID=1629051 RepID=UPI000F77CD56|nr:SURF1 family protein [Specibacter cremeus]
MLRTALKAKWIATLVLALAIAAVFVLLSQWQFNRSLRTDTPPPAVTEHSKPLIDAITLGQPLMGSDEGQIVSATGHFDPTRQVIVNARLQGGLRGYWVVTAFVVDGAPKLTGAGATGETVIPVARGWLADPAQAGPPPSGPIMLTGRLLDSEGPVADHALPAGQVGALSSAELANTWQRTTYAAFVISYKELADGVPVATAGLTPITVTATDQNNKINWLNIFYSVEWVVFAGFAVFLWWRLVRDDYKREHGIDDHDAYDDGDDDDVGAGETVPPTLEQEETK